MTLQDMIDRLYTPYCMFIDEKIAQHYLCLLTKDPEHYLERRVNIVDRSKFWHMWS